MNEVLPNKTELQSAYTHYYSTFKKLLENIEVNLKDSIHLSSTPAYKSRIKSFKSYYRKLLRVKPISFGIQDLPVLTDLIGIRIICPFLEDIQLVEKQLVEKFTILEIERKGSDRTFSEFGYESTHILIEVPTEFKKSLNLPDGLICEIQVRTILQDAWAEVEHELVYKSEFSPFDLPLKRKLASMNASLSLADIVFQEIRDYQNKLNSELDYRRSNFYDKAEVLSRKNLEYAPPTESQEKIQAPSPYVKGTIDDLILTAIQAHNAGRVKDAIQIYSQIIDAGEKPNDIILSVVLKHRGLAYFAESEYELALKDFTQSSQLDPNAARSYYYIGIVHSVMGDERTAVENFTQSLEHQEFQSHVYYRRALSFYHLGEYSTSLTDLDRCKSLGLEDNDCLQLRKNILTKIKMT